MEHFVSRKAEMKKQAGKEESNIQKNSDAEYEHATKQKHKQQEENRHRTKRQIKSRPTKW